MQIARNIVIWTINQFTPTIGRTSTVFGTLFLTSMVNLMGIMMFMAFFLVLHLLNLLQSLVNWARIIYHMKNSDVSYHIQSLDDKSPQIMEQICSNQNMNKDLMLQLIKYIAWVYVAIFVWKPLIIFAIIESITDILINEVVQIFKSKK